MHAFHCRYYIFIVVFIFSYCACDIVISEDLAMVLYDSYKKAVINDRDTVSFRRTFQDRKFEIHVKKLRAVNGYKKHNLIIKEDSPKNPLIYIDNPLETRLPHAYLTYEEFKKELQNRVLRSRQEFAKPDYSTTTHKTRNKRKKKLPLKKDIVNKAKSKSFEFRTPLSSKGQIKRKTKVPDSYHVDKLRDRVNKAQRLVTEPVSDSKKEKPQEDLTNVRQKKPTELKTTSTNHHPVSIGTDIVETYIDTKNTTTSKTQLRKNKKNQMANVTKDDTSSIFNQTELTTVVTESTTEVDGSEYSTFDTTTPNEYVKDTTTREIDVTEIHVDENTTELVTDIPVIDTESLELTEHYSEKITITEAIPTLTTRTRLSKPLVFMQEEDKTQHP